MENITTAESGSYDYDINHGFLEKDLLTIDSLQYENIYLCGYHVTCSGRYPFLRYMLSPDLASGELHFPKVNLYSNFGNDSLFFYGLVVLSTLFHVDNFEEFYDKIIFRGFYETGNNLYLFFDLSSVNIDAISDVYANSHIHFALIDEIANHGHVCNIPIAKSVTTFFMQNDSLSLLFLRKDDSVPFEIPQVAFVSHSTENKLKFVTMFGESAKTKEAILGPYYYFTDLEHALRQEGAQGIVRFALFTGRTKCIHNLPEDSNDNSITKQQMVHQERENIEHLNKVETMTYRISDHDGLWAKEYGSVYLGEIEMDDGNYIPNTPLIVVKEYNQQVPLSYHFINQSRSGIV